MKFDLATPFIHFCPYFYYLHLSCIPTPLIHLTYILDPKISLISDLFPKTIKIRVSKISFLCNITLHFYQHLKTLIYQAFNPILIFYPRHQYYRLHVKFLGYFAFPINIVKMLYLCCFYIYLDLSRYISRLGYFTFLQL